jgi:alcohol dehydrogenase class IV
LELKAPSSHGSEIRYGWGIFDTLPLNVDLQKSLVVTTAGTRRRLQLDKIFSPTTLVFDDVEALPSLTGLEDAHKRFSNKGIQHIIGIGGGSVIDTAKALALALLQPYPLDILKNSSALPALPLIIVPTTAGTGSEVTPYSTIWDRLNYKKLSLTSDKIIPQVVYLDPQLATTCPWETTLFSGLDCLTQCLESLWNKNFHPSVTSFSGEAITLTLNNLAQLQTDLSYRKAREALAIAGLYSGYCIGVTRTAVCHAISYPLTAHYGMPHGLACAFSLRSVLQRSLNAQLPPLIQVLRNIGFASQAGFEQKIESIFSDLDVNTHLQKYLTCKNDVIRLLDEMNYPGRMDNFSLPVDRAALTEIIDHSLASAEISK